MVKAIIFDFFDVIYSDCLRVWLDKHGYKKEGKIAEASYLIDSGVISEKEFMERLAEVSGMTAKDVESELDSFAICDFEVVEFIKKLRADYPIGLISNAGAEYLRFLLKDNDLESLFDEILISAEVGMVKPEEKIFRLMLDKLKVHSSETIFIDDHKRNVDAAVSLGIHGIWYQGLEKLQNELTSLGIIKNLKI